MSCLRSISSLFHSVIFLWNLWNTFRVNLTPSILIIARIWTLYKRKVVLYNQYPKHYWEARIRTEKSRSLRLTLSEITLTWHFYDIFRSQARLCKALQETIDWRKVLVVSSITVSLFLLSPNKGHGAGREHERQPSDGSCLRVLGQDNMNRFGSDTKMLFKWERWAYQVNTGLYYRSDTKRHHT